MLQMKYFNESPFAVTVCDKEGIIIYMNEKSKLTFASYGGGELIGRNLMDCHPEAAQIKITELLKLRERNAYTIEKNGRRKLIYQTPWYADGEFAGLIELSLELPDEMPHFRRG